jgi:chromosome segregation ATPase
MLGLRRKPPVASPSIAAENVTPPPEASEAPGPAARDPAQLRNLVDFTTATADTATNIGWITHDIREVADSTTRIVSSVDKLAGTTAELSSSSSETAEETVRLRQESSSCEAQMREAGDAMRMVRTRVTAMSDRLGVLESAVTQIADMAKTIEAISKQTNLLALNATIEAARAGEAGRGFAVVAGEVKSLSAQTAQATEQIRTRIATLTAEMNEIRQAILESSNSVEAGEATVTSAGERVAAIGDRIEAITQRMTALTDVLGQQQAATDEISGSGTKIADKAKKTRKEIQASLDRLVSAQTAGRDAIDAATPDGDHVAELYRARADMTIWKRALAATLVGLVKPDAIDSDDRRLADWCETLANPDLRRHPAFAQLRDGQAKARTDAQRMIDAVRAGDWKTATDAYVAAEAAITTVIAQADALAAAAR